MELRKFGLLPINALFIHNGTVYQKVTEWKEGAKTYNARTYIGDKPYFIHYNTLVTPHGA